MRDIIVLSIVFGTLLFAFTRPHIGVLLWCWLSYMNPHRLGWGFAYDFPVAAITAGVLLISLLLSKEPKRIPWLPVTVVWLFFVIWMSITTVFALVPEDAMVGWEKMIKIQLVSFITLMVMNTKDRLNALVIIIVVSLGFYGIKGGIFTVLTGGEYIIWGPEGSFIGGNNEIGLALIMTLPLMNYLRVTAERKWVRNGMLAAMGLTALTVLATYSRGAFLAAGAMAAFLVLKSDKKFVTVIAAVLAIPLLLAFMPEAWYERMATIKDYQQDGSAMGRINAWSFAINVAKDRLLTGGGFETFHPDLFLRYAPVPTDFHDAHSIYFEVLGEHGFIGLGLFLLLGFLALRTGTWIRKKTKDRADMKWNRELAAMTYVSLVGYAVGGTFLGLAYFDFYYHLIAIMVLNRAIVEKALLAGETGRDVNAKGWRRAAPLKNRPGHAVRGRRVANRLRSPDP